MPSLWHESGRWTAIEALSLGIPVVACNHGGLAEHLGAEATLIRVSDQLRATPRLIPPQ
jgi:glycosyltransferase involved in cell wall biosynthesis